MVKMRGFTLVELMVTLTLLAFLLALAIPFTSAWSNSAKLRGAENLLQQGIGRANALALRNHHGMTDSHPAASLCLDTTSQELRLEEATSTAEANCSNGAPVWKAKLPDGATIKAGANDFACVALNSRGLLVSQAGCSTNPSYTLAVGGESVTITIN